MSNKTLLLVLLLACTLSAQQFIQLGSNLKLHNLSEMHQIETNSLDCSPELSDVGTSMEAWSEILENQDQLNTDSLNLQYLKGAIQEFKGSGFDDVQPVLLQFRNSFSDIMSQISAHHLQITPYQRWRKDSAMELQGVVSYLDKAENENDLNTCCDKIEELINRLLKEREQVRNQCQQGPQITINIINTKADQVREITKECKDGQGTIIRIKPKEDGVIIPDKSIPITDDQNKQVKPIKPTDRIPQQEDEEDPSDPSSTTDEEDTDDSSNKKKPADFTQPKPVVEKEQESSEPLTEYGYGYWAKFLLAYPKFLPNGKDAPWYFVSRLSANKKDENINMGDRLLAIWLGKGYYHFTTCDQPKNQPNVAQNVNYPEDLDGVWTYIYYSYSVEKKRAVAFIKFGNDDVKKIVHEVQNPSTKWVKFTIGGKDQDRYPGFNGLLQQIFFSVKPGVFLDNVEDVIGKLQSQKKQPKDFLPELVSYKVVSNPLQRDPDTKEVVSIVGTAKNPKFPHEYAISGWFKWEQPQNQQDWHNIFRVQIQTPSTDKFLGDRTLSAWVGKQDGGIIHLPTYTYTNLEGAGNANVPKNIPHKDRHKEWFFVYFGYSRPQKKAVATIVWKDSQEKQDYDNIKHFQVPKYYIFVGKDKQFPGFNGKVGLVAFNVGEGAFRPNNDFQGKGDPFNFDTGRKKLIGVQPEIDTEEDPAKQKKPYKVEDPVVDGLVRPSSSEENKPVIDENQESENDLVEYGYGFWMRFLTVHPDRLLNGKNAPWYFVSRLTSNMNYKNIDMGDRLLAIWQGQGYYHFTTCDQPKNQPNVIQNINYPNDIEGLWTYVYYSYSAEAKKAIAFIKYGDQEPRSILHSVQHPAAKKVKFILGGMDNKQYPGFNGLFSQVTFSARPGVFLDTLEEFQDQLKRTIIPKQDLDKFYNHELVGDILTRRPADNPDYDEIGGGQEMFPHEYAISGWFKWEQTQQQVWHNVFRVQIKKPSTDRYLGDRTLSCWIGTAQGGILHFPTYTYTNMNGAGNPNLVSNIQHKNRIFDWFFVYFGYSKNQQKAFVGVRFASGIETLDYSNVNHYYAPKFYTFVGKDMHFPGLNGKVAYVNFNLGDGTFKKTPDFKHPDDIFGLTKGEINVLKKPEQKKVQPEVDKATGETQIPNSVSDNAPKVTKEFKGDQPLSEYGYGFWMRYLTAFPTFMQTGKSAPWYFVARLANRPNYDNAAMGDRTLAIWQGQGYYHFTTCDKPSNNVNVIKNINYPEDIEGLWTYVYYSYSVAEKKAVAFIQYGNTEPNSIVHQVTHPENTYVKFILGGKDNNRYPAFNGVFQSVVHSAAPGVYIGSMDGFKAFLNKQPNPIASKVPLTTSPLVENQVQRNPGTPSVQQTVEAPFPKEYAVSGWFKWEQPTQQQPWHNMFRVQLKQPSTDSDLGDRTLAAWVGSGAGGIIHLTTYSYRNMNGAGSNNLPQNINHKDRHNEWFFVYLGYSKNEKQAYAYIKWRDSENNLEYKDINHYLAKKFFIFVGKDVQFPGFNGRIAQTVFNVGEGTFKKGNDFTHPTDAFKFDKGSQLIPKVDPTKPVVDDKTEYGSKHNNNAPNVDKTLQGSGSNLVEYGYGFWMRFLTVYPERMFNGKNQPWYFVSRLTTNENYDNIRMGDRALAIWQGQGYYHYTTCNKQNGNVNVIQNINYPADIEGLWTYVYYSYSAEAKKAVGFIKYGNAEVQSITHQVVHPETKSVRFILGGMDNNRYPAFNGIFTRVTYSHQKGAFIDSLDNLRPRIGIVPEVDTPAATSKVLAGILERPANVARTNGGIGDELTKLPQEYSISGWYKWDKLNGQEPWHSIFRVSIKIPFSDKFLGDRTLAVWVGTANGGILHHTTYSYANMNGEGNPNVIQNIVHKDRHQEWFFSYFGYSKKDSKAYAYIKFKDSEESLTFQNINHYLPPKLYLFLGKDPNFQGFNGKIGYVNLNIGKGSFKTGNDFTDDNDRHGFTEGAKGISKPVDPAKPDAVPEPDKQIFTSPSSGDSPKVDKQTVPNEQNLVEYGYGYWMRFLTKYPEQLPNGKNQPWYFVSRLTTNIQYDNIRMGDRALAIWQGQGYYHFTTCDIKTNNANVIKNNDHPTDIEGVWTYVYYSYSAQEKNAVGFIKYGDADFQQITHPVTHPDAKQVRFILGGSDDKRYPAFNGLFTNVYFNSKVGAYINSIPNLNTLLNNQGPKPSIKNADLATTVLVEKETTRAPKDEPITTEVEEKKLPHQYAFSGWFRWSATTQEPWHNIFRVQIKTPSTDNTLGDRTLSAWVGTQDGGIYHFPTYTYTNMNGAGNSNLYKNIQHKGRYTEWHFVYFGYSKDQNRAQVYVKWTQSEDTLDYPDTRHYFASKFYIFTARDKHFPGFNGLVAQARFNTGEGAFVPEKNFNLPKDPFSFNAGVDTYHKDVPKPKPEVKPDSTVLDNAQSSANPVIDKEIKSEKDFDSYGYGFWMRYLTVYPERQIAGKNQPWYFVSRLTWNEKYDNIAMGDRVLAIWQGAGYYHFTSCNVATGNVNQIQNINFPNDIEGLWTYVYYSYSRSAKQAVAFIQYGNAEPQTAIHQTQHKDTKYLRFILGGNDATRYPGFNGQFTNVNYDQNYIGTMEDFKNWVGKLGVPSIGVQKLTTTQLVDSVNRNADQDISKEATVGGGDLKFPQEYAISGWFKWKPTAQAAWHNTFRVQIKKPSTDNVLGDRTLTMWVGTPEGGILHFPTYSYENMVGAGNVNYYKNIQHKNRHQEWFYVYYGYSRVVSKAQVFVKWSGSDDALVFDNVRHYLTPEFYVFVGRDKQYPGFSGKLGYVKFNIGDGAYLKDPNFDHPDDAFGYKAGVDNIIKKPTTPINAGQVLPDELTNGFEQKVPVVDKAMPGEREYEEYGYGFWFRFLHTFPQRLPSGKNQPWYFVARLANQEKYDNIRMGDRMLAVWQGQGYYHFTACNKVDNNPNYIKNINYPEDIEGVWTYLYYSYSDDKNRAVGFIKYGNDEIQSIRHDINQPETKYLRFILGGNDDGRYPGFNGVFTQVTFSAKEGAFIDTTDQLKGHMSKLTQPIQVFNDLANYKLVSDSLTRTADDKPLNKVIGKDTERFPAEYSFSGWFKWQPLAQNPWHTIFRVQVKTPSTDNTLGDRTLSAWVGTAEGGIIHLPTYTYNNMNGAGNANVWKNIQHKNKHTNWFFLYFGYSKDQQLAQAYIKWSDGEDQLTHEKVKHYLATQFYVFAGRCEHFPGFNGKIGEVNFNLGKGAFRKPSDYTHDKDVFGYSSGLDKFVKKPSDEFKPQEANKDILENPSSQDKPVVDNVAQQENPFEQYGYGFWLRFLTKYPDQLPAGKNQAWYFVSRLANQEKYDNIRMGDRMLAVWQGQGYYHFTACSAPTNNPNLIQNNNYPDDIEGLWTYIYYSYSSDQNKAIGFIKYGSADFQKIVHETTQPLTKYLRFIIGGNDAKRYPGFNGLFTSVTFSTQSAFVSDADKLNAYLLKNQPPTIVVPLQTSELVKDQITRDKDEKPSVVQSIGSNNKFPLEYAISGWYRWKPTAQAPWHNVFRVQIKKAPVTDSVLGDRTLTCWVGTAEGGILHFPTYTYSNMNGAGNVNFYKNIQHKNKINEWFYVYYGYSKTLALTQIYVKWFDSEDSMSYDKIYHYLTPEFQVWVGKDEAFVGHNGRIAYVNFNAGDGAFVKSNKFDHPQDIFKYNVGQAKLFDAQPEVKPGQINKDVLESPTSQDKPVIDTNVNGDKNLEEYGYGFWMRFLTAYPERMFNGKNQPWYFVARLANQEAYDNIRMGDRMLAIWQGQGYYHYTTCNAINGNVNVIQNIDHPADIEGMWAYIYYSYSEAKSRAVGFIKYGTDDAIKSIRHDVTHPDTKYVRFILGGTDNKRYPAFNGLFTQVTFDAVRGVFIDTADQLKQYMSKLDNPVIGQVDLATYKLVDEQQFRDKNNDPLFNVVGKDSERFPLEYAISGWYKFQNSPQDAWQNIFRVSINAKAQDTQLGDRTLSAWLGTAEGGIIHLPTYTYANMNGAGNANVWKNIQHKNRHTKWFFIYFGYSKLQAKAYSYTKWEADDDSLNYDNTNHYYAPNFQVFVGRDKFFTGWNGKQAYVNFNLGKGAFRSAKDFSHPNDVFGTDASKKLQPQVGGFQPGDANPAILENAFNQDKPHIDKEFEQENPFEQYGYGLWVRFLTLYPQRLVNGKNEAWYFIARLANQKEYDNIRLGDRMLAIWQGTFYYHFTTCNGVTGSVNLFQNVDFPKDLEGVWTYIYYSYSSEANKAIGFIKYGDDKFLQITHETTHPTTKYLRFILGGNDAKRYPGFNGLFSQVSYSTQPGAYVDNVDQLTKYVNTIPYPKLGLNSQNNPLVKDPITRNFNDDSYYKEIVDESIRFPFEYSFSGWFRWVDATGNPKDQFQTMFRVALRKDFADNLLGDRVMGCWVGPDILQLVTYSYNGMSNTGIQNALNEKPHQNRHLKWFFIYIGYSRDERLAYSYIEFSNKQTEVYTWEKINHYVTPRFFIWVGKDKVGYQGQIGNTNFNIGPGSFRKGTDFNHEKNIFGYDAQFTQSKVKPFSPNDKVNDMITSTAPNQEKPSYTKVIPDDEVGSTEEYGYGFWARYLTQYPAPQRSGMTGEWTFVSRLTKNQKLDNVALGDRVLAIFLNRNSAYFFSTVNGGNPNAYVASQGRVDFEGVWTYIHFAHNLEKKSSVAWLKYGNEKAIKFQQTVTHVQPQFLQFYLGGKDFYVAWNGQFTSVMVSASRGIFIDDEAALNKLLENVKQPAQFNYDLKTVEVIKKEQVFDAKTEVKETMYTEDFALRPEYAWSGWMKYDSMPPAAWGLIARLSIYQNPENMQALGDRTLSCWTNGGGNIFQCSTYNYQNLVGGGNVDSWNRFTYGQEVVRWFYMYFGYSFTEKAAYYRVEFKGRTEEFTYKDHKHYYANILSLQVAKDKFHQPFLGTIAYFRLNVGEGAYRTSGYDKAKNDIFAYNMGKEAYVRPSPQFDLNKDTQKGTLDSPVDGKDPVFTKKYVGSDLDDVNEYGYSFWLRYLTHYPKQQLGPMAGVWNFVARLTKNQVLGDIAVGDRVLAIWLNNGNFYHFTTYHQGNPNTPQNIQTNIDVIDGIWMHIHFSYSFSNKQAVGFLHNSDKLQKAVFQAEHQIATYLQFYLGGVHLTYPSFNGQFSNVIVSVGDGIFLKEEAQYTDFVKDFVKPDMFNKKLETKKVIEGPKEFNKDTPKDEQVFTEYALVGEYSWSGWFKWTPTVQQAWHLMVRLSTLQDSQDLTYLGDRVLSAWVGAGYLHFTCYTATNSNGAGNVNQWQNMNYETDYTKWHFIYYGYSRLQKLAHSKVEFRDRVAELLFKNTLQFLPNKFSFYTAKDKVYAAYSGTIAHLRFNGGEGAFDPKTYDANKQDIFGYNIGRDTVKEKEPEVDPLRAQELGDSAFNQDKPVFVQEFKKDELANIQEYGYGFYYRHLEQYPVQMRDGRPDPWYMMSRLSWNTDNDNIRMGDRLLATWQEQAAILFVTNDLPGNPNMLGRIAVPEREGLWTFLYFSYSLEEQLAVGILKFDGVDEVFHIPMKCNHGKVNFLRFTLGEGTPHFYPRFNGQFANWAVKLGPGAFVKNYDAKKKYLLNRIPHPPADDKTFKQVKVVEGEKQFKGDSQDEVVIEVPSEMSKFSTEYSISGWLRWDNPPAGAPWYNVFRLSLYHPDQNAENRFGDRDLALYKHAAYYQYHTYNYQPGAPWTFDFQIPHTDQHLVWHFFYSGYSKEKGIQYHLISFQESDVDKVFDKQKHLVVNKHYLSFGKDYKKFYNSHRGFTGTAALVNLNYGDGAFTMKPFTKKNDLFNFADGEKKYRKPFELVEIWSEADKPIPSAAESKETAFIIELFDGKDKTNIRGLDEYGWVAWIRSSRTEPKNLPQRFPYHQIGRLTTQKDNKDLGQPGDRTLALWLSWPTYYFATYTQGNNDVPQQIPYKVIDGNWIFVSFSYKKGQAKAYAVFSDKDIGELVFNVKHDLVGDYLRFNSGGEEKYKSFNGHLLNVGIRFGVGAHIATKEDVAKQVFGGAWKLPDSVKIDQSRLSIPILKDKKEFKDNGEPVFVNVKPEQARGKDEYSISGWARWIDPAQIVTWHLLYRVQIYDKDVDGFKNLDRPGDRTLSCWKGIGIFYMATYTIDQGNAGAWNVERTNPYDEVLHKNWVYFYQGYSRQKQMTHFYIKYTTRDVHFDVPSNHFVPTQFFVQFGKDQWHGGWNGFLESWYFNTGVGSYKTTDYGVDETEQLSFGFGGRALPVPKNWESPEMFQNNWGPTDQSLGKEVEIKDDYINGLTEYSYGMWTRFIWNGERKLIDKPAWMALSRLTYRPNYQGDAAQIGDRLLAIWVGAGYYHFTTSTQGNANLINNVNYNTMLDGQWNYIYFGYKKLDKGGRVQGHVFFGGTTVRSTNYPEIVNHLPLSDYLYFCVGSSGAKLKTNYHSFNGHISNVILMLGDGAFTENADELRKKLPEMPKFPVIEPIKEIIFEEQKELKRDVATVSPVEWPDKFAGQFEYSVSLWFKWSTIGRATWENVYTLSYMEQNVRANHVRPGDRVLSLFQYSDHRQFFSTYTTPDTHDAFAQIYTECPTPALDQNAWVYAYYAYSRNAASVYSFYKTRTTECEKKLPAVHRVPRYFGLYVGKDGIHTPYNGRYQQLYLMAGAGAYRDKDVLSFDPYIAGALGVASKPYKWSDKKDQIEVPNDATPVNVEFDPASVDGHSAYAIGFWSRYLTAIPKRVLDKPAWVSVARFTVNKDHQDQARVGDRTLGLWLGKGFYAFRTYNLASNQPTIAQDVKYDDKLEGEWNFIYFCFASSKQQAIGYVKFGSTGEVRRVTFPEITHKPIENYGRIVVGKEFSYQGFNGQMSQLQMIFGGQGYVPDVDTLETMIKTTFPQPDLTIPDAQVLKIQEDEVNKKVGDAPQMTEWPNQYQESLEYSIFGWFRYQQPKLQKDNNVFIRLTNNEPAYRKEAATVGDRTLLIMYQPNEVVFSTYTLGTVDDGLVANIRKPTPLGNNFGVWTYVWFGYSWPKKIASGIVKFPTDKAVVPYENVYHMIPKYFALFAGSDGLLGGWDGPMRKVGAIFGKGAYVDPTKGNYENMLPNLLGITEKKTAWKAEKEEIIVVPIKDKPAYDLTFKEEVGGVTEYGYGIWTRWLQTTPERVVEKAPFHQLIRLTNTEKYEDNVALGNRVLAIWAGRGYYHFTTYDKKTNKASISANSNYDDFVEGHWNYLYFSFTSQDQARAVGFVHFGELPGQMVSRIEMIDIAHNPLNGFARVVVANNEFGYPAFNGMITGLRIFFGQGFVGSKEQFIKDVLAVQPKPQLTVPARTDINVLKDQKAVNKGDADIPLKSFQDQYQGVLEYAVSGWVQTKKGQADELSRLVYRLTINDPLIQKDKSLAGDRTLTCFVLKDQFVFSSYDYGNIDNNAENQNDIQWPSKIQSNGGEWVFLYFAYNFKIKKAFAYTLFTNRELGNQYNDLKHLVPNKFWFYLGGDQFNQQFEGTLYNWNLNFGDGAFTTKPRQVISGWPYEPQQQAADQVLSVLLGNQGLSSIKLSRAAGPASGQFDVVGGPKSGQTDQAQGPKSGIPDGSQKPNSGIPDQGSVPKSGTQ